MSEIEMEELMKKWFI